MEGEVTDLMEKARVWYLSIWPGAERHPESFDPDTASLTALLAEVWREAQDELFGTEPCSKCGIGVVPGCLGCRVTESEAEVARLEEQILRCVDVDRGTTDMMIEARRIRAAKGE